MVESMRTEPQVFGETASDVARAFLYFNTTKRIDGTYHVDASVPAEHSEAFVRAFMRVDAELLQADAALVGRVPPSKIRTDEQRRADALVELVQKTGAALSIGNR